MPVLDDIDSLEQAVQHLAALCQQDTSFESAFALQKARYQLAAALTGKTALAPAVWPPENVPDVFVNKHTVIPEIPAQDMGALPVLSGILHHGCVLVRGLFDATTTDQLREAGKRQLLSVQQGEYEPRGTYPDDWCQSAKACGGMRQFTRNERSLQIGDYPLLSAQVLAAFQQSGLTALVTALLGEHPAMLWSKWGFRHVPVDAVKAIAASGLSPWHQDGQFMGPDIRAINAWISLCDCGVDAPGITVLPKRVGLVKTGTGNAPREDVVGEDVVAELASDAPVHSPAFGPGDVLLFDKYLLHRTQAFHPSMVTTRYAIESWFAGPSTYDQAAFFYGKFPLFAC